MNEITDDHIRPYAHWLWTNRGGGDGFALADWLTARRYVEFFSRYAPICCYQFNTNSRPQILRDKEQMCRFCHKSKPNVSFTNRAHVVPEFLGNRSILAEYECDVCNAAFGKSLEDHLGRLTNPIRTMTRLRGKKKLPAYKSSSQKSKIETKDDVGLIRVGDGDNLLEVDRDQNQIHIHLTTAPYVPLRAFQALLKIAIMLMPESEMPHFPRAVAWLMDSRQANECLITPATCVEMFTPIEFQSPRAILYRRRDESILSPYMILVLLGRQLTLQIPIGPSEKDAHLFQKKIQFPVFPIGFGMSYDCGEPSIISLDLSSATIQTTQSPLTIQVVGPIPSRIQPTVSTQ